MLAGQIWSALILAYKIVSEYDQDLPQSQTADNPKVQGRSLIKGYLHLLSHGFSLNFAY